MKFLPDDGHIHQYTDGTCEWCGKTEADATGDRAHSVKQGGALVHEGHSEGLHEGHPSLIEYTVDERIATEEIVEDTSNEDIEAEIVNDEAIRDLANPLIALAEGAKEAGAEVTETVMVATHVKFMVAVLTDESIRHFAAEAARVLEWAKTLEIVDNASAKLVAGELRAIAILKRGVTDRTKELLAPMTDALKQMKDDLATVAAPLAEADKIGRQKVTDWDKLQRQIKADAEEATRKIAEAAALARKVTDAGGEAPDLSAIEPIEVPEDRGPIRPDSGGTVSMVDHWSAEIEDEDLIPRHWMMPNMQMLNLEARQRKGTRPIPGVKWVNNPTPSVR